MHLVVKTSHPPSPLGCHPPAPGSPQGWWEVKRVWAGGDAGAEMERKAFRRKRKKMRRRKSQELGVGPA